MNKINHITYALILRELLDGEISAYDAVEVSGIHIKTAQEFMRTLKAYKVVHICSWEPNTRGIDTTPVYKLGPGKDKPRRKKSVAERMRVCRAKKAALEMINGMLL